MDVYDFLITLVLVSGLAIIVIGLLTHQSTYFLSGGFIAIGFYLYLLFLMKLTSFEVHSTVYRVGLYVIAILFICVVLGYIISFIMQVNVPHIAQFEISIFEAIHTNLIVGSSILVAIAGIFGKNNKILLKQTIFIALIVILMSLGSLEFYSLYNSYKFDFLIIINAEFLLIIILFKILYNIIGRPGYPFEITYTTSEGTLGHEKEHVAILNIAARTPHEAFMSIRADNRLRNRRNAEDRLFLEIKNGEIKRIRKL
ncbi:MAG: hypothetical protein KGH69_02875 [Candidatus Micrarchaeota archaeon]|nr:hypothetical protein [Candidatus Micrarchaeota archaeon]MDE1851606.1 hypothetical protein [Candidatus Micrarchaeota archaeon]